MRERLGASEASVEDADLDATSPSAGAGVDKTVAGQRGSGKLRSGVSARGGVAGGDDSDPDESADDSEAELPPRAGGKASGKTREKRASSSRASRVSSKPARQSARDAGDLLTPDLVEDLGAWSDED